MKKAKRKPKEHKPKLSLKEALRLPHILGPWHTFYVRQNPRQEIRKPTSEFAKGELARLRTMNLDP